MQRAGETLTLPVDEATVWYASSVPASRTVRYLLGVAFPVVSAVATFVFWKWLQPAVSLLFFPAVMLSAMYGGLGAGIMATAVSVVLAMFFYLPPIYSLSIGLDDVARLVIFASAAVLTASLSSARRRAEATLRQANAELRSALDALRVLSRDLERRVEARTADLAASNDVLQSEMRERTRLANQLVRVEETERRRLSRELHDQVGQLLTALKLMLEAIRRAPARDRVDEAIGLVESLMTQIREMSLDLRPSLLDDLGLVPALLWHVDRYSAQTGIQVQFTQSALDGRLDSEIETAAFRIVQEALTNVARHAHALQAQVWLRSDQAELCVIVEDGGRGFDPAAEHLQRSTGVRGMRERVTLLGGRFELQSAAGMGTRVTATFPLRQGERAA